VSTLWGVNASVDLGNALVGLGGFALAVATWRATSSSNRSFEAGLKLQANQKLAEFRVEWAEILRSDVAKFMAMIYVKPEHMKSNDDFFLRLAEAKHRIILRLQSDKHKFMIIALNEALRVARNGSDDELHHRINVLHQESEKLLEEAWSKASDPLQI